jgi:hypothetical protein
MRLFNRLRPTCCLSSRFSASNNLFVSPPTYLITIIRHALTNILYYFRYILLHTVFSKPSNICTFLKTVKCLLSVTLNLAILFCNIMPRLATYLSPFHLHALCILSYCKVQPKTGHEGSASRDVALLFL